MVLVEGKTDIADVCGVVISTTQTMQLTRTLLSLASVLAVFAEEEKVEPCTALKGDKFYDLRGVAAK